MRQGCSLREETGRSGFLMVRDGLSRRMVFPPVRIASHSARRVCTKDLDFSFVSHWDRSGLREMRPSRDMALFAITHGRPSSMFSLNPRIK